MRKLPLAFIFTLAFSMPIPAHTAGDLDANGYRLVPRGGHRPFIIMKAIAGALFLGKAVMYAATMPNNFEQKRDLSVVADENASRSQDPACDSNCHWDIGSIQSWNSNVFSNALIGVGFALIAADLVAATTSVVTAVQHTNWAMITTGAAGVLAAAKIGMEAYRYIKIHDAKNNHSDQLTPRAQDSLRTADDSSFKSMLVASLSSIIAVGAPILYCLAMIFQAIASDPS